MAKPELTSYTSKEQASDGLVAYGLKISHNRYGTESPPEGIYLAYHNPFHTQDVISAVTKIGMLGIERGKIDFPTVDLLRIAAAFHDVVQLKGSGVNEELSAGNAGYAMRTTGMFSEKDVEKVRGFIMATQVFPVEDTIEQAPTSDYATQVICDADLALLGGEDESYWQRSTDLLRELKRSSKITEEDFRRFLESQQLLLGVHRFFTPEAAEIFPRQQEHLKETIRILGNPVEFSDFFARTIG